MRYALLVYANTEKSASMTPDEGQAMMQGYLQLDRDLAVKGTKLAGEALQPIASATTVRVRSGKTLTTDGPFAETKEHLGGFYVLECANLDEAIAWAAKVPNAKTGSVEIRPIWDWREGT